MSKQQIEQPQQKASRALWICAAVIVVFGCCIYANSFDAPFVLDGRSEIENNSVIRRVWPPWGWLTYNVRPLAYFTFALDYELYGFGDADSGPRGFHFTNIVIHLVAALLLFGILRRTLQRGRGEERFAEHATYLAAGIALIWMAHPLQTQSVTYVVQRIEALMGLFVLLSLYCFVVAQRSASPKLWLSISVVSCLLGLVTKEVAAVIPLLVIVYDRIYVAESWRDLFKQRRGYYLALFGTWVVFGIFLAARWSRYHGRIGNIEGISPMQYALTQPGVLTHYLRLTILPIGQCLDYWWPLATKPAEIVPGMIFILSLLGLTFWALYRYPQWGFWGWWFFVILGPTSTIVPIQDLAFEHRMYLSLAGLAALFVLGGYEIAQRTGFVSKRVWLFGVVPVVILILGITSFIRNETYRTRVSLWQDVVAKAPNNPRAYLNLGLALDEEGKHYEAIQVFLKVIQADPDYEQIADVYNNLGATYLAVNNSRNAQRAFQKALEIDPTYPRAYTNLGVMLARSGQIEAAVPYFQKAVELAPDNPEFQTNLGQALQKTDPQKAAEHYQRALEIDPDYERARVNLHEISQ